MLDDAVEVKEGKMEERKERGREVGVVVARKDVEERGRGALRGAGCVRLNGECGVGWWWMTITGRVDAIQRGAATAGKRNVARARRRAARRELEDVTGDGQRRKVIATGPSLRPW